MRIVHHFKQAPGFVLASQISAGWKSVAIRLQFTVSSAKILLCLSCDKSPAPFTLSLLPEIHTEDNHSRLGYMIFLLASEIISLIFTYCFFNFFESKTKQDCIVFSFFSYLPILLILPVPFLFSDVCCCSICLGFFPTTFSGHLGFFWLLFSHCI